MKKVCIIGGGLGGLSAALRLSAEPNYQITILEKEPIFGGKLKAFRWGDFYFDSGPSTLTYIESFEDAFYCAGNNIHDHVTFYKIDPLQRHFFPDGTNLDLTADIHSMQRQIAAYSVHDAQNYPAFIERIKTLLKYSEQSFFDKTFTSKKEMLDLKLIYHFFKVQPFNKMAAVIRRYFHHPNTISLFSRYATYVGGQPTQTPAVFNLMAALETQKGVFGIKGGTYKLVEAFQKVLAERNVTFHYQTEVKEVLNREQQRKLLKTTAGDFEADIVVVNQDILSFEGQTVPKVEPSLSGFQMMLSVDKKYEQLKHHNIFYPQNYEREFQELFEKRLPVCEPAIYICNSSTSDPHLAPAGMSNLFVLVNAPALTEATDWEGIKAAYAQKIIGLLESHGMSDLQAHILHQKVVTPLDLQNQTFAYRGSIYGPSSNSMKQSFFRANGKLKGDNMWAVGGSIHPGGGTPMVVLGGRKIAEQIINIEKN